ncbi:MAG: leucyl aminopeptidase family protein [Woeseiaceae bacterium]|nr:leucyl aminopeptidase family protein [Woeseiaceae bacterium]
MPSPLAEKIPESKIRIVQHDGPPSSSVLEAIDQLLLILPAKPAQKTWSVVPHGSKVKALLKRRSSGSVPGISTRLSNHRQTALHVGLLDSKIDAFEQLSFGRKMLAAALAENAGCVGIWVHGFDTGQQRVITERLCAAALAAGFALPRFKCANRQSGINSLRVVGLDERIDLRRTVAEAGGNNLARWLTAMPPNKLDARGYVKLLQELARKHRWEFRKYGITELKKLGAGAFLAVAQGNADESAAMVRLRYRPRRNVANPALSLVGKGIIFDTGGINLKPFQSMLEMHIDMGGSAVAVGTLQAISELALPVPVDCWLAITENRTGPTAYKPQDLITSASGKTIQTIHTDAEGRMALADTLTFACRDKPGFLIDYATLTGACINAVTPRYSGAFTNRQKLHPVLKKTGVECGERVWPFPMGKEFLEELKSDSADLKQCAPNAGGDHILAATFLNEFVDKTIPWVHIDLSACTRKGGLAHIPTDITGFGVRYTMSLLLDRKVLDGAEWE